MKKEHLMAKKTASVEVRSEQLAQAVVDILAEQGRGALTREKISERAGLSRPLIYYYFNSAEAVLASSFRWICHKLMVREEQMAGKAEDAEGLPSIVQTFVPQSENTRKLYRAFFALLPEAAIKDDLRGEVAQLRARRREMLAQLLLEASRTGDVRPPDGCDLDAITGLLESAAMRAAVESPQERGIVGNAADALQRYLRPFRPAVAA
jgi:AcrR family transcriptional regulator